MSLFSVVFFFAAIKLVTTVLISFYSWELAQKHLFV